MPIKQAEILLEQPVREDGQAIHALVQQCPPLDVNAIYTYLLLSEHFTRTCVVARRQDEVVGFVSAYRHPDRETVLFIWQVAVHASARGMGLGLSMLRHLLQRPGLEGVRTIETTVGPENRASRRMFARIAQAAHADIRESALFEPHLFGPQAHEDERLLRIGPLNFQPLEVSTQ
ncbi:MAG: diaminobutyrate acetyltransferase [Castellaniella sp.]